MHDSAVESDGHRSDGTLSESHAGTVRVGLYADEGMHAHEGGMVIGPSSPSSSFIRLVIISSFFSVTCDRWDKGKWF